MSGKDGHESASELGTLPHDHPTVSNPALNQHQSLGLSFPKSTDSPGIEQGSLSYLFDLDTASLFQDFQMDLDENAQGEDADQRQAEPTKENRGLYHENSRQAQGVSQQVTLHDSGAGECENVAVQASNSSSEGKQQQSASMRHSDVLAASQLVSGENGNAHTVKCSYSSDGSEDLTPEKQVMQSTDSVHATLENIVTPGSLKKRKKHVHFKTDLVNVRTFYKDDDSLSTEAYKKSPETEVRPILKRRTERRKLVPVTNAPPLLPKNEACTSNPSASDCHVHIPSLAFEREQSRRYLAEHLVELDCTMQTMVSETNSLMRRLHRLHQRIH